MSISGTRTVITIDGLAASGKSTLAKLLAQKLSYIHVNTGLLYRAAALLALNRSISEQDPESLFTLIQEHKFEFAYSADTGSRLMIDGLDVTDQLQSQEVASFTSKLAAIPEVREALRPLQILAFGASPIVVEGRDTGTVIFPDAQVKFFVEGDAVVRATRRTRDLQSGLASAELEQAISAVAQQLRERDLRDSGREFAPLKKAKDAVVIDNSGDLNETLEAMVKLVRSKI